LRPLIDELHGWLEKAPATLSRKSETAAAALPAVCLGRTHSSWAGSDDDGEHAAATYALTGSAKLNSLDPELYLRQVLERIADHPTHQRTPALEYQPTDTDPLL
jgi:transposase